MSRLLLFLQCLSLVRERGMWRRDGRGSSSGFFSGVAVTVAVASASAAPFAPERLLRLGSGSRRAGLVFRLPLSFPTAEREESDHGGRGGGGGAAEQPRVEARGIGSRRRRRRRGRCRCRCCCCPLRCPRGEAAPVPSVVGRPRGRRLAGRREGSGARDNAPGRERRRRRRRGRGRGRGRRARQRRRRELELGEGGRVEARRGRLWSCRGGGGGGGAVGCWVERGRERGRRGRRCESTGREGCEEEGSRGEKGRNFFCFRTSAIVAAAAAAPAVVSLSFVAPATSSSAFFFRARVVGALDWMRIASEFRGKRKERFEWSIDRNEEEASVFFVDQSLASSSASLLRLQLSLPSLRSPFSSPPLLLPCCSLSPWSSGSSLRRPGEGPASAADLKPWQRLFRSTEKSSAETKIKMKKLARPIKTAKKNSKT